MENNIVQIISNGMEGEGIAKCENKVIFVDKNKIKAIENNLGIWLDIGSYEGITSKLDRVEKFLSTHIDLFLIDIKTINYSV